MQLQELARRLQAVGLSEKPARIYVAALTLGPTTAQKIAEQAAVNRPTTYDILKELSKMGLISQTSEGAKSLFVPAPPHALVQLLRDESAALRQKQKQLDELMPALTHIERPNNTMPSVRFVRGLDGIQKALDQLHRSARPKTEILSIINEDEVLRVIPEHVPTNAKKRVSKHIRSKQFIYNSHKTIPNSSPETLRESIQVDSPFAGDVTLFEDKALLVAYGAEKHSWNGIIIENEKIVETLRQIFTIAWDAKKQKK